MTTSLKGISHPPPARHQPFRNGNIWLSLYLLPHSLHHLDLFQRGFTWNESERAEASRTFQRPSSARRDGTTAPPFPSPSPTISNCRNETTATRCPAWGLISRSPTGRCSTGGEDVHPSALRRSQAGAGLGSPSMCENVPAIAAAEGKAAIGCGYCGGDPARRICVSVSTVNF